MTSKAQLRYSARGRDEPTVAESVRICAELATWLLPQMPALVLTYLPLPGEIDLFSLSESVPNADWALTRTPFEGPLTIHRLDSDLESHRFGFLQPVADTPVVFDSDVSIVLVPGLFFDPRGGRLGRGMGYYDGLLGRLGAESVGVSLERWVLDEVPVESHDRLVGWLATESGVNRTG